jgi:hypothetical protein
VYGDGKSATPLHSELPRFEHKLALSLRKSSGTVTI